MNKIFALLQRPSTVVGLAHTKRNLMASYVLYSSPTKSPFCYKYIRSGKCPNSAISEVICLLKVLAVVYVSYLFLIRVSKA